MKNLMGIIALLACFAVMAQVTAIAQDEKSFNTPEIDPEQGISFDREEKQLVMHFVGQHQEEGVLEFFISKSKFSHSPADEAPIADELNRISPAAGVQFRLEF